MSRAFVKETAEQAAPPERMVDEGPNLVTRLALDLNTTFAIYRK
jgi:hypothetical protein